MPRSDEDRELLDAIRELAREVRALRRELQVGRDKQVRTRRVKAAKTAARLQDVPIDDVAAAAARRAIAKVNEFVPGGRLRPGFRDWLCDQRARGGGQPPGRKPATFLEG